MMIEFSPIACAIGDQKYYQLRAHRHLRSIAPKRMLAVLYHRHALQITGATDAYFT